MRFVPRTLATFLCFFAAGLLSAQTITTIAGSPNNPGFSGSSGPALDGKNDLFRIPPSLGVKLNSFAVFDRWGTRVFYPTNSATGWDGSLDGQPQPVGTYVWMIEYQDLLTGKPV